MPSPRFAHRRERTRRHRSEWSHLEQPRSARLHERRGDAILIDFRSRAKAAFVGIAEGVDKHIHCMVVDDFWELDEERGAYRLVVNPDFPEAVEPYLGSRRVGWDAPIMLICRSGNRSARAAARIGWRVVEC